MKRIVQFLCLCLMVPLSGLLTGCLVSRSHSALALATQPLTRTALLPVDGPSSYEKMKFSPEDVMQTGNDVLDTLAKAKEGRLIGPSEVVSHLGNDGIPTCLRGETLDNNMGMDSNACAAARELASRLGVSQVVRCWLNPPIPSQSFFMDPGGCGVEWSGYIKVDMELITLDPLRVVRTSTASGEAEQIKGCLMFMMPVYYGTIFGRAMDKAERTALAHLFEVDHHP